MSTADASDVFEAGRAKGLEDGAAEPLTEDQERNVRVLLRQAEVATPPASRRKAS